MGIFDFFTGTDPEYEQVSNLTPSQMRLQREKEKASKGAFKQAANYYRGNLSQNPDDFQAFAAPDIRQFQEQTIPDLAEQFAGMGAGNLSSSGFRNAAVGAGSDLSERLAYLRANLRSQAAQGLQGLAGGSLTPHTQYQQTQEGSPGLFGTIGQGIGSVLPGAAQGILNGFGKSSPYGNNGNSSPSPSNYNNSFGSLPKFGQGF
jgi:hypothetical protein